MPQVDLDRETLRARGSLRSPLASEVLAALRTSPRLDSIRVDDESCDELITEPINIYETEEFRLAHGGDHVGPD